MAGKAIVKRNDEIREIARRIAQESPTLQDLTPEQLSKVTGAVIADALKDELKRRVDLERVDYSKERAAFLASLHSVGTRRVYSAQLARLDEWAASKGLSPLEMKPKDADDFIYVLRSNGRAASSINLTIAAASAFYTFLERRHDHIKNPFRGTKARPKKSPTRPLAVPTDAEVQTIIKALSGPYRASAVVMARRGLRVGALPSLSIRDGRFKATSKGKDIAGDMPENCIKAIRRAKLEMSRPFDGITEEQIKDHFRYIAGKLHKAGAIGARYSVHDLRHFYAVNEYRREKDIYRLKQLLDHATIGVTETYLKGIGEV